MSRLIMAAAAAALMFAPLSPALAQDAEAPASPVTPAPTPADLTFQEQGTAFEAETRQMGLEIQAIMEDETLEKDVKTVRTDAVLTKYQPKFDAFAEVLKSYLTELANRPERTAEKDQILAAAEAMPAQISGAPAMMRAGIQQALEAPAEAPVAE